MAVKEEKIENLYAVIRACGKQYRVANGMRIRLNKVDANPGDQIKVDEVLLLSSGSENDERKILVGSPLVSGASVTLKILGLAKEKKVKIFKKKRRTGYTKRQGHRQKVTEAVVENIAMPA